MDVKSYGAQFGDSSADAARAALQATVDAASRSRIRRTGFGFTLGKLGVHYSSEKVEVGAGGTAGNKPGERADSTVPGDTGARRDGAASAADIGDRVRRAQELFRRKQTARGGTSDPETAGPGDLRRRRSLRNALNAYIDTESQIERREFEPRLLAVV